MITRKNDAFDGKFVNTRLTKIFIVIFAPDERLPSSDTLSDMQKSCPKHQFATKQNHNLEQQFAKKIVSRIIICNFKIITRNNNNMVDHFQARFSFEDHYQDKEL